MRRYACSGQGLSLPPAPCRRYPGAATLPDGRVLIVGGTVDSGKAGYHVEENPEFNNPTYCTYDPATK